jgi:RNA polymerase sigma factor (sigma-70 family)
MYLLLTTQGVDCEIGTKFDQYQMTKGMGNVIQTDIKLNKGLIKWREKHKVKVTTESFNFNTCLGIARAVANLYSVDYGAGQFDDAYSSALEGVSRAFTAWNPDKHDTFKSFVRICCKNAVFGELRKVYRWNNEMPFSVMDKLDDYKTGGGKEDEYGGSYDSLPFSERVSTNTEVVFKPLWIEETMNPEEECIREEELRIARSKVHKLQSGLNERELYVLWNNIIGDEPMSMREIASQFKVDKSSIHRDAKRIRKLLEIKEI